MSGDWFCKVGDQEQGPLTFDELKAKAAAGVIRSDTPVRKGKHPWSRADRFAFLQLALSQTNNLIANSESDADQSIAIPSLPLPDVAPAMETQARNTPSDNATVADPMAHSDLQSCNAQPNKHSTIRWLGNWPVFFITGSATTLLKPEAELQIADGKCPCCGQAMKLKYMLLVSMARKPALNSRGMFSEPAMHLLIRPCPFKRMSVAMIVFRPRSQHMRLEFLLALP
jgi:hypothetical protein